MKWLGADPATGDSDSPSSAMLGNGHHAPSPQMLRHPQVREHVYPSSTEAGSEAPGRPQVRGSQDDSFVGYVFQRAQTDPDFPQYAANKQPARWALGDDTFIDNHHLGYDRWKVGSKMATSMMAPGQMPAPGVPSYDMHQQATMLKQHQELVYLSAMNPGHTQFVGAVPVRNGQIATSAKKLWGVEDHQKDDKGGGGGGILQHLGDHHQVWRDSTWSTSDHAVSQPISMAPRRSGSFPGSDAASILSPRSSETGGLGVKMVEYVLSASPTSKDLEPRLRALGLNGPDGKKEGNDKAPSPFEGGSGSGQKDGDGSNATQNGQQGGQNGLGDEDKGFNRTPGSRQPSPAEEQMAGGKHKSDDQQQQQQPMNPVALSSNVVVVPVPNTVAAVAQGPVAMHHAAMHHAGMHPSMHQHQHAHHLQQQQLSLDGNGGFDHGMLDHSNGSAGHQQQQQLFADNGNGVQSQGGYGMIAPPQQQQQPMDSPGVMPGFDIQVGTYTLLVLLL